MNHSYARAAELQVEAWKTSFGAFDPHPSLHVPEERLEAVFNVVSERLEGNYPFHHPVYAGQMLKSPHHVALSAYALAASINPNNHALDGGPPSSEMEKEVIKRLAFFFGYDSTCLGHLTSSGTIGNLEALWVAREIHPQKSIAFSSNAHYTHGRMCGVLGIESQVIEIDENGEFKLDEVDPRSIGTFVVTLGTTGLGKTEALHQVVVWAKTHDIRIHIDAAYGGFFRVLAHSSLIDGTNWKLMQEADSMVVDPHKHGLQPYGCGCVLFKNPEVARFYLHDSPYTYYTSDDLHLGEISLECSRAGAAAVALWATLECFPLEEARGFGPIMGACRKAALTFEQNIAESRKLTMLSPPELDIVTYFPSHKGNKPVTSLSECSEAARTVFERGMESRQFYLSLYTMSADAFLKLHPEFRKDSEQVTILRSVLMRPEHEMFAEELVRRIEQAV
ncbi:MAG: pyridoxal-dependent decarboxylase [Bacteroidota bacterium]